MTRRVMFYVQNLLGVGHLHRAATISRAMVAAGLEIHVCSGSPPDAAIDFGGTAVTNLPFVRAADASFKSLLNEAGAPIDTEWKDQRRAELLGAFERINPDILMIELFPFGRRQFRFELIPLLELAKPRAKIVCSVRDVLVQKDNPDRNREIVTTARQWFDRILVHGDQQLIPFTATFPEAEELADLIAYTGYVADHGEVPENTDLGKGEVIVSTGGGAVGEALLRAAMASRPLTALAAAPWRLLAGGNLPEEVVAKLKSIAPDGVSVERARPDFRTLLRNAALSVSQGGYNTVMDVLTARCRSVVVPFAEQGESEQTYRARVLAGRGLISVVESKDLDPGALARAIDSANQASKPKLGGLNLSGAAAAAQMIAAL